MLSAERFVATIVTLVCLACTGLIAFLLLSGSLRSAAEIAATVALAAWIGVWTGWLLSRQRDGHRVADSRVQYIAQLSHWVRHPDRSV